MLFLNLSHTRSSKVGLIKKCLNPIFRRFFPQLLLIVVSFFGSDKNFNLRLVGGLEKNNIHCSLSLDSWNSSDKQSVQRLTAHCAPRPNNDI